MIKFDYSEVDVTIPSEEEITQRFPVHHYEEDIPVFVVQIEPGMETNPEMVSWMEKVVQLSCEDLGFDDDQEVRLEYSSERFILDDEDDEKETVYPY
jgi:hypothetical protein